MSRRGMTLIEMLIAVALTSIVMTISVSVLITGVTVARKGEQTVSSNEAARTGMEMLLRDLRSAGMGTPGGLWVADPGSTPFRINPIFTQAGTNGTDVLWLVVPRPMMMAADCAQRGSGVVVTESGTGTLNVGCTTPALATSDTLLVTNFTTGALLSGLTFPSASTINYAQSHSTFSNAPEKGGFQRGDIAVPVEIIRYSIGTRTVDLGAGPVAQPVLLREVGGMNGTVTVAAPFAVPANAPVQVFNDIEDLQVAFGTGTPPGLTFTSAHTIAFNVAAPPQAVRVNVVGITPLPIRTSDGNRLEPYTPVTVEDHAPTATVDGHRRSIYRRRVDLVNMNPVNL